MLGLLAKLARFGKFVGLLLIQRLQRNIVSLKRSWLFSPATQPDAWKVIACRHDLYPSRIFRPKTVKDKSPLVVMVHGGGFVMNNPSADDPLSRLLADECSCTVISIDYRKAPMYAFPAAYEDVVEAVLAILAEGVESEQYAPEIVLCGSSAGGNLVLAAAQDERLCNKLLGLVALYPIANMVPTAAEQLATRPNPAIPDFLGNKWDGVLDIYPGTNDAETLRDPRLSPTYFKRGEDLPQHILMVGCEHDMLCHEAKVMAEKLAADTPRTPRDDGWQAGGVRWMLVQGHTHGFDHFAKRNRDEEAARVRDRDLLYRDIAGWLSNVLSKS